MKYLIIILSIFLVAGCASTPNRIPTLKEAISEQNGSLDTGVYNKPNGENVSVEVKSMRAELESAQKKAYEAQREADYAKLRQQQLQDENTLLRARGNYRLERQVNELQGFDNQGNAIVRPKVENPEPRRMPEESSYRVPAAHPILPRPAPTLSAPEQIAVSPAQPLQASEPVSIPSQPLEVIDRSVKDVAIPAAQ